MSNFLSRWLDRFLGKPAAETSPATRPAALPVATSAVEMTAPYASSVTPLVPAEVLLPTPPLAPPQPDLDLSGIEKQIGKLGREQFKLNSLIDLLQQQAQAAQQQLSEQAKLHDKGVAELRAGHQAALKAEVAEARLQAVLRVLPALDGWEDALASGHRLLDRMVRFAAPLRPPDSSVSRASASAWLLILPADMNGTAQAGTSALQLAHMAPFDPAELAAVNDAYAAWLKGLGMIRGRLLDALAREGVQPIEAIGQPFDPNQHIAVEVVGDADTPAGTIVSVSRRGYAMGERVLRYAEVIVARGLAAEDTPGDAVVDDAEDLVSEADPPNESSFGEVVDLARSASDEANKSPFD